MERIKPLSDIRAEKDFLSFCFRQLVLYGKGIEMTLPLGDLQAKMSSELPSKDPVNQYRKKFGNLQQCLKQVETQFYNMQDCTISMKSFKEIEKLTQMGVVDLEDFQIYEKFYEENAREKLHILALRNYNICRNCGLQYNININPEKICKFIADTHSPKTSITIFNSDTWEKPKKQHIPHYDFEKLFPEIFQKQKTAKNGIKSKK